jgi:hypothetical protein
MTPCFEKGLFWHSYSEVEELLLREAEEVYNLLQGR